MVEQVHSLHQSQVFKQYHKIVGIGTTSKDDSDLQGINSARGMYVSNGMMIMDNTFNGNHYIGTNI